MLEYIKLYIYTYFKNNYIYTKQNLVEMSNVYQWHSHSITTLTYTVP